MNIDNKNTDWLFYESRFKDALDANPYNDPEYLRLNFPHRKNFCDKLLTCSLKEFVSTLIWIFKDKYPSEYRFIEISQVEQKTIEEITNELLDLKTNIRKNKDIEPLEFVENENFRGILSSLKIAFINYNIDVYNWIEEVVAGKEYTKKDSNNITTYTFSDSAIESIEATPNYVLIKVNQGKAIN